MFTSVPEEEKMEPSKPDFLEGYYKANQNLPTQYQAQLGRVFVNGEQFVEVASGSRVPLALGFN